MPTAKFKPKSIREAMVMRWDCGFVGEKTLCREQCTCSKLWLALEEASLVHTDWVLLTLGRDLENFGNYTEDKLVLK